jgi:hypothetical protein
MTRESRTEQELVDLVREVAMQLGHPPSRSEFKRNTGVAENQWLRHFQGYRELVRAAGLEPDATNILLDDTDLLQNWGEFVRKQRRIPTRSQYQREGKYSSGVFEKHFGPWSGLPKVFRDFADGKPEWSDVLALLPTIPVNQSVAENSPTNTTQPNITNVSFARQPQLSDRPTYGNPIDFRGLRHEPVNEQGVVFLFGMVARELGYMVEAIQTGFPDCEAKRQISPRKWQRVRIEFEFESRNFRDHGHSVSGCDVIVCWQHNWPECPENIEVLELSTVIASLGRDEE